MNLKDFSFVLPDTLIAYYPAATRTGSRLMCLDGPTGAVSHKQFTDVVDLIHADDLLILNNTRVIPARLHGYKVTGGKVEVLVERIVDDETVLAHVKASKSPGIGMMLRLEESMMLEVTGRVKDLFVLQSQSKKSIIELLEGVGHIPLPPYIKRQDEPLDRERYQTVYAEHNGSVAAPTAGLHFDEPLLERLAEKGVDIGYLTLHVGAGTFQPLRVDDIKEHTIHSEFIEVPTEVCEKVQACRARGGRVIAVGTTSVRALESACSEGKIQPFSGETNIYIYPGYQFNCVDAMITNFHLPESSLLLLVSAFAGHVQVMAAYEAAVKAHYRFYSYGDAMFVTRQTPVA